MGCSSSPSGGKLPALTGQGELLLDPELREWLELAEQGRPLVRGDCEAEDGPCPWVGCRYHLWAERIEDFERLVEDGPDDWGDTCALDVADRTRAAKSRRMKRRRTRRKEKKKDERLKNPIGRPGPVCVRDGNGWRWAWPGSSEEGPFETNRAVVGRFLGGVSRETVRLDELRALQALRGDPAIVEAYPWVVEVVGVEQE